MARTSAFLAAAIVIASMHIPAQSIRAHSSAIAQNDSNGVDSPDFNGGSSDEDDLDTPAPNAIAPTRTSTDTLAIYDLRGRRITTPQRHTLYIYKGKKYVRR